MTIKVKLRQKPISGKRLSLYLDFYPAISHPKTGKQTRRDFLGLYVFDKPKTVIDKLHNAEMVKIANQVMQKRVAELNKPEIYTGYEKEQLKIRVKGENSFIEYFKSLADKRAASNHDNWISAYQYLHRFTKGELKFTDLDHIFCNDFRDYLLNTPSTKSNKTKLSQNSALSYFNKFKAALKQAYKDGFLQTDLNKNVEAVKPEETRRHYLTLEELTKLAKTDWPNPVLKNAALFSALTGLRYSDIKKLTWSEIEFIKGQGYFILFQQQKTGSIENLPISEQAFGFLGKKKNPDEKVFEGLSDRDRYHYFPLWITKAGITKPLTFHCLRHTYATLQLSNGSDLYTVSKMLGHKDLKTTQVYAKIVDQSKRDAANRIVLKF